MVRRGALLVDAQRRRQGDLPGAVVIDRTVLEWRLDPDSAWLHRATDLEGGVEARLAAGLPVTDETADVRT